MGFYRDLQQWVLRRYFIGQRQQQIWSLLVKTRRCPTSTTSKTQNWWEIWRQTPCFTMAHHGFPFILRGKSSATPADSCRWRTSCSSWKRCGRQLSLWLDPYTADDWIWLVLFPRFEAWRWEKYHGHVAANRDAIRKIVEHWDVTEAKKGETKASNSRWISAGGRIDPGFQPTFGMNPVTDAAWGWVNTYGVPVVPVVPVRK